MYTTACVACRKVGAKGYDPNEKCERCGRMGIDCTTIRRRVGRQAGVKNRKSDHSRGSSASHSGGRNERHHLPTPLHALASVAANKQATPVPEQSLSQDDIRASRSSSTIMDKYASWLKELHPEMARGFMGQRIDALLSDDQWPSLEEREGPVFSGRTDMARLDAAPEHDVISLNIISLADAKELYASFLSSLRNGHIHLDPRIHTLSFVRSRSSFLLAVVLAIASSFKCLCSSPHLYPRLMAHVFKLEDHIRINHLKSVEIVQALIILVCFTEMTANLCRDKAWSFVSLAIAMATELRLDSPLPHCVQMDPSYGDGYDELLVRNAHRTCFMLYIHDRSMAMIAGRFPLYPESRLTSPKSLGQWGLQTSAQSIDSVICASVSLRRIVTELQTKIGSQKDPHFTAQKAIIDDAMAQWRAEWADEIATTMEYEIIARFSSFVLLLTVLREHQDEVQDDIVRRQVCEDSAFEVVCAAVAHYKSWTHILNSATFDVCMITFCANYVIQHIKRSSPTQLSDWSVFRLAMLQELVAEFDKQAEQRHPLKHPDTMNVCQGMACQISSGVSSLLKRKTALAAAPCLLWAPDHGLTVVDPNSHNATDVDAQNGGDLLTGISDPLSQLLPSAFSEPDFMRFFNNPQPFFIDWNLDDIFRSDAAGILQSR